MPQPMPSWHTTLHRLAARGEPLVRMRAAASLARLGDPTAEALLARAAREERRVEVRAEAIHRLSELPSAAAHLSLSLSTNMLLRRTTSATGRTASTSQQPSRPRWHWAEWAEREP